MLKTPMVCSLIIKKKICGSTGFEYVRKCKMKTSPDWANTIHKYDFENKVILKLI